MAITPETRVHDLIEHHPYLLDFLARYNTAYEKLRNPVVYNTVGRLATLRAAAELGDVAVEDLIEAIEREMAMHRIHAEPAVGADTDDTEPDTTRAQRLEKLKEIIGSLHDGASVEDVKAEFDHLVSDVDAFEIAAMEQALIAEGMPAEEVQRLCDVHVAVFRESLDASPEAPALPQGHPVESYRRENEQARRIVTSVRSSLDELEKAPAGEAGPLFERIASQIEDLLGGLSTHYIRKENQLFPVLERHGIEGPTKVMWGLDDEIRDRLKSDLASARSRDAAGLAGSLPDTLRTVDDMIYKEEKILLPAALDALSNEDWDEMAAGDGEIGFAWTETYAPGDAARTPEAGTDTGSPAEYPDEALPLTTGALSLEQVDLILRSLPIDVTFVDETGRVRYYSEGERVFPRSPAVIGREVRNCHPPKSVAVVERIVEEFRAGKKDTAEFWIELGDRFVHIRYFALRDGDGAYRGVLEVSQDVTGIRALEGERRLLDWD